MYTLKKQKLDYVFLNLSEESQIDKYKIIDFIDIVSLQKPKIIFSYNCLDYKDIDCIIDKLCSCFMSYVIRCDKFKHVVKINDNKMFIDELHINMDPLLCLYKAKKSYCDSLKILDYFNDIDKQNICDCCFDLYVNDDLNFLHSTLKILSGMNYKSCIYFKEVKKNDNYNFKYSTSKILETNSENLIYLDTILSDKNLLISNKDYVKNIMKKHNFEDKCNTDNFINYITLNYNFKIQLCNCIDKEIDLDPFVCLDSNGYPNEQLCKITSQYKNKYCYGCSCSEFNF